MRFKLILSLLLLFIVALFAVQNADVVTIKFMVWEVDISQALMMFLIFAIGLIIGLFIPSVIRKPINPPKPIPPIA